MKRIVSYFGNLYMPEFKLHVEEMKVKGFNTILFCITETDALYNLEIFKEFREYAESVGMECWATFWGRFAGEAVRNDLSLADWLYSVHNIGFHEVFIDEPKGQLSDLIQDLNNLNSRHLGSIINFHLCLCDKTFNSMSDKEILNLNVLSLGVSNYHWITDALEISKRSAKIANRLNKLRPDDNFVFIQGFDIPEGAEVIPSLVRLTCISCGIVNFGFWSFRCTAATGIKRPVNYQKIWGDLDFNKPLLYE